MNRPSAPWLDDRVTFIPDDVAFRRAVPSDVPAITELERAAWPKGDAMQADEAKFATRVAIGGVTVAVRPGRIVGMLTTFRPRWANLAALTELLAGDAGALFELDPVERWAVLNSRHGLPRTWHHATADGTLEGGAMHDPAGRVVFGVGLATDPRERGKNIAKGLLDRALRDATADGAECFLGYSRLPQYHRVEAELDAYLATPCQRGDYQAPHDFGLRVHWSVGAKPLRARDGRMRFVPIPGSMRDDSESRNAGALIINPLRARIAFPFEQLLLSLDAKRRA